MRSRLDDPLLAWDDVVADAAERRARCLAERALVVVAAFSNEDGERQLRCLVAPANLRAPTAIIVGAHPACDVSGVHGACLRHLVLIVDPSIPGVVRVIDLNTPDGLVIDGEPGIRAAAACGSLRIGAGSADLLALSLAADEPLPPLPVERLRVIGRARAVPPNERPPLSVQADAELPHRAPTREEPPPGLGSRGKTHVSRVGITVVEPPPARAGALRLRPSRQELERGIVLGRYDRCHTRLSDERVSRVHALLIARGDDVLVIDTASTNGTDVIIGVSITALGILNRSMVVPRRAGPFTVQIANTLVDVI
jgi:hypothetical protein